MKKIFAALFLTITTAVFAQQSFTGVGDQRAYVGANFQDKGTGISAGYDYGVGESISIGGQVGLILSASKIDGSKAQFKDRIDLKVRFNANLGRVFNFPEQIDFYPGLNLSLKHLGMHAGVRYFFQKGFGLYSEINFTIARYKSSPKNFDYLNNQFAFQIGAAFDLN